MESEVSASPNPLQRGMMERTRGAFHDFFSDSLRKNSIYLVFNGVAATAIGAVFWLIAARYMSETDIGRFSAVISFANLAVAFSGIGLATGLIRYLPETKENERNCLINSSLTLTSTIVIIFSLTYIIGIPVWSGSMKFLYSYPFLLFGVILLAVFNMLTININSIFISFRESRFVMAKEMIFNTLKVSFLPIFLFLGFGGLMLSWLAALSISIAFSIVMLIKKFGYKFFLRINKKATQKMLSFSLGNYIAGFLANLPVFLLPLIFINTTSAGETAQFYITWMIANVLFMVPKGICTSLFAEGSNNPNIIRKNSKKALYLIFIFVIPLILFFWFLGDMALSLFGEGYSTAGKTLLRLLAVSTVPLALIHIFITLKRVEKKVKEIIFIETIVAAGTITITYSLIPEYGIVAAGIGWLISLTAALAVIITLGIAELFKRNRTSGLKTFNIGS